jgi:hypothetical protein
MHRAGFNKRAAHALGQALCYDDGVGYLGRLRRDCLNDARGSFRGLFVLINTPLVSKDWEEPRTSRIKVSNISTSTIPFMPLHSFTANLAPTTWKNEDQFYGQTSHHSMDILEMPSPGEKRPKHEPTNALRVLRLWMLELYFHSYIHLHGLVLNWAQRKF